MGQLAFVFSGQGSQYAGMGRELYDHHDCVKQIYQMGSEILEMDLLKLSETATEAELSQTGLAQPLTYTLSMAAFALLRQEGIVSGAVAGFSLGECSAVTAAGGLTPEDGFRLIKARAAFMQQASESGNGSMSAIIGLPDETVEQLCTAAGGYVLPVNYNCDGQLVIAGETLAVEQVEKQALEAGASKAVRLAVSGAFHSKLMEEASIQLEQALAGVTSHPLAMPLYAGVTGEKVTALESIPAYFRRQMVSPVRWKHCVKTMMDDGFDTFVELGPRKTLCGLIRRVDRSNRVMNVEDEKTLAKALAELK